MARKADIRKQDRGQYVVKANDLIRKTRYNLSTQQQRILLYFISKIKPNDTADTTYSIDVKDICHACGLPIDTQGTYYKVIKDNLLYLTTRLWCEFPDRLSTVSWLGDVNIYPHSSLVEVKFHPVIAPYLFELREQYTQYKLENVLLFKSKYAIRLYEYLRSFVPQKTLNSLEYDDEKAITARLCDLREILSVEDKYKRWSEFERNIIKKAIGEINQYAEDIHVDYTAHSGKGTRMIERIEFIITSPKINQIVHARTEKRKKLDK